MCIFLIFGIFVLKTLLTLWHSVWSISQNRLLSSELLLHLYTRLYIAFSIPIIEFLNEIWLDEKGLMINETMKRTSGQMWVNNINHIKLIIIDYKKVWDHYDKKSKYKEILGVRYYINMNILSYITKCDP